MSSLVRAVEARDRYTHGHTARVASGARRVGQELGMPSRDLEELVLAAEIHDVGKVGIPDSILLKPGPLTNSEAESMRLHPIIGFDIVGPLHDMPRVADVVLHHHERLDGNGYPDRLRAEQIPLWARIVSVCDSFDAMTSDRPYRRAKSVNEAIETLLVGAGSQWDGEIVDAFLTASQTSRARGSLVTAAASAANEFQHQGVI